MRIIKLLLMFFISIGYSFYAVAQNGCVEIERILVAACGSGSEGYNEMMLFRSGASPLDLSTIQASWPGNNYSFLGLIQDATTADKVAEINATIQACGYLKEPVGGIIPANSKVLFFTSYKVSATFNSFATLSDTLIAIFQNNSNRTGGHFLNYTTVGSSGDKQTVVLSFGSNCSDEVSYTRSKLITTSGTVGNEPGATVLFLDDGTPTYINEGCVGAFSPYNAGWKSPGTLCNNNPPINLNKLITGTKGGTWSGPGVTDSILNVSGLSGDITISYSISPLPNCPQFPPPVESKVISILPGVDASWTNPDFICSSMGSFDLNTLVTGTPGGTWTGWNVQTNGIWNFAGLLGTFPVSYMVANGLCKDTVFQTVTLVFSPVPTVSGPKTYCVGDAVQALNVSPASGGSIKWYADSALTQELAAGNTYTPEAANRTYYVVQTVNTCQSQARVVKIEFLNALTPTGDTLVYYCAGSSLPKLTVSSETNVNWYSNSGLTDLLGSGLDYQLSSVLNEVYAVSEIGSCKSAPLKIRLSPMGQITAQIIPVPATSLCLASEIVLKSAEKGMNQWSNESSADSIIVTSPGTYTLTRTGACNTDVATIEIVGEPVNAHLTVSPDSGYAPLTVTANGSAENANQCKWYINDSLITFSGEGQLTFPVSGNHILKMICSNDAGCIDTSSVTIFVIDDQLAMEIPNVFSPNNDNVNDKFKVNHKAVKTFNAFIFNRWGKQLYEWSDKNEGWDGTTKGKLVPDGIYFYIIKGTDVKDNAFEYKGTVHVIDAAK